MIKSYQNTNPYFVKYLLHQIPGLSPNISKVLGMYYDHTKADYNLLLSYKNEIETRVIEEINDSKMLESLLFIKQNFRNKSWINADTITMSNGINHLKTPTIFSELEDTVLMLRLPNQDNHNYDMMIFYFEDNLNAISLSAQDENLLTVENKQIIANLIYNHIKISYRQFNDEKKIRQMYNNRLQKMILETKSLEQQIHQEKKRYNTQIQEYCLHLLDKISAEYGLNFTFEPEALEKIIASKVPLSSYQSIIQEACVIAADYKLDEGKNIAIKSAYIFTDNDSWQLAQDKKQHPVNTSVTKARFDETWNLLDEFEKSAQSLVITGEKVIGCLFFTTNQDP